MTENSQLNSFIKKSNIAALPVLPHTLQELKAALEKPSFNYRHLDAILHFDPACMINLLSYANQEINKDFDKDINQVEHAAMFLGMERLEQFIGKISSTHSIKDKRIAEKMLQLQHRGVHAAFQAQNFARMIHDSSVSEIYTSTLVSPISELLIWHLEPQKAQKVELLIHIEKKDYEQSQRDIFGFSYHELAIALTLQWKIPNLFLQRQEMSELETASKAVKCIYLAEKCSIMAEKGWYYDKMYDHIDLCSEQLHFSAGRIAQELHKTSIAMARSSLDFFHSQATASYLALLPGEVPYTQTIEIEPEVAKTIQKKAFSKPETKKHNTGFSVHQQEAQKKTSETIVTAERTKIASVNLIPSASDFPTLIRRTMNALIETQAFTRVAFLMLSKDKKTLQVRSLQGYKSHKFTQSDLRTQPANLFTKLLAKPQIIFINQLNYKKFSPIITPPMQEMLAVEEFIAKSVHVNGKPIGLFYMDKHPLKEEDTIEAMDVSDFNHVKKIAALFEKQLKNISR